MDFPPSEQDPAPVEEEGDSSEGDYSEEAVGHEQQQQGQDHESEGEDAQHVYSPMPPVAPTVILVDSPFFDPLAQVCCQHHCYPFCLSIIYGLDHTFDIFPQVLTLCRRHG